MIGPVLIAIGLTILVLLMAYRQPFDPSDL